MTFANRLEELLQYPEFSGGMHAAHFLANNADAILELVRAADRACIQRGLDDQHELRQALAKLNREQT